MRRSATWAAVAIVSVGLSACNPNSEGAQTGGAAAAAAPVFTVVTLDAFRQTPGAAVREAMSFAQEDCGERALGFEDGAITSADLNGDGRPDYMVDMSRITCGGEPAGSSWCGSGGCSFDLFTSTAADYRLDGYLGMEPEIVRHGDGLAVAAIGREGPWLIAWDGSEMAIAQAMGEAAPANAAAHAAGGDDEAAVRAVVASIYDAYADGFDSGSRVPDNVETDSLRSVIDAAIDPDMGGLGFDYYCACQDYGDVTYSITGVALNGDRATVAVDFRSYGRLTQLELRMRKTAGRWQVDDVIDPNGSLRAQLGG